MTGYRELQVAATAWKRADISPIQYDTLSENPLRLSVQLSAASFILHLDQALGMPCVVTWSIVALSCIHGVVKV
jgi:hypothetical protein